MSFLQKSIEDGSLVLWHDYRSWNGTFDDLSGNGNDGVGSNVEFRGGGVYFRDPDGYIMVADSNELQLTTGTLIVLGHFVRLERPSASFSRLISKRDGGGTNYDFGLDDTPKIDLWDGTTTRSRNVDYRGAHSIGVTFANGAIPTGYLNGLELGAFNDTVAIAVNDAPVYIGNNFNGARSVYNPLQAVLIFNRILTETEMSKVHGELMHIQRW